ncbi:MAG TPA: NADH-quinone oxidoreductase subunit L [Dehalococcoidia bacterium]|nr:NADH-quinone oxidoreductase subunit L [Dehalococcoidia bacterium]
MTGEWGWLIIALPVLGFLITGLALRRGPRAAGWVGTLGVAAACLLSWLAFFAIVADPSLRLTSQAYWVTMLDRTVQLGVQIDALTAVMLIVVTTVSLLVHLFSMGYLADDPGYARYFTFLSLFTASMLTLVLADNLILLFIGWEMVGVCSYLLIGHWFERPEPAAAAKKAFLVTRLADVPFLIAVVYFYNAAGGTTQYETLFGLVQAGTLGGIGLTLGTLGLFSGAVGKSAQFPLHVWLPDAMEGPTPVSALIHAATMVAAGVYMVGRLYPMFQGAGATLSVVAWIGAITAFVAATMGLVMFDIKRVLAYSTISQLGYMMLGLGVGGAGAALFHLFNHAFFKALLFLGSGSVIHGTGTQDMREMGGLRRYMPVTFWTYLIGSASLAGFPLLSGFWSKDEILGDAFAHGQIALYLIGLITAFLTAFYSFRMVFLTFFGSYRGAQPVREGGTAVHAGPALPATGATSVPEPQHLTPAADAAEAGQDAGHGAHGSGHSAGHGGHGGAHRRPHESPFIMLLPLVVLAVPAIFSGYLNVFPHGWFSHLIHFEAGELNPLLLVVAAVVAIAGIALAYLMYVAPVISPVQVGAAFRRVGLYQLVVHKYFLDDLYNLLVQVVVLGTSWINQWIDASIVDGIVNGVARLAGLIGWGVRRVETGRVQAYALTIFAGVVILTGVMFVLRSA